MSVPVLVPLELRQLQSEVDFCADERCLSCGLFAKLLRVIDDKADQINRLQTLVGEAREYIAVLEGRLEEIEEPVHHGYLLWSSAYQPLAS